MSDVDPTINGVGGEGFAVDGTDSFAVDPDVHADEPEGSPGSRRGLFLTVATGLALVLIVVIAGSAGGGDSDSLRGGDVSTTNPERNTTTTTDRTDPDSDADLSSRTTSARSGDEARSPIEAESEFDDASTDETFDSEFTEDDYTYDDFDFDDFDFDDFDADDDDDFSSGGGSYLPRRVPIPPTRRPVPAVPPLHRPATTQPTVPATQPTTTTETTAPPADTTTTVADTTTSSSSTTTTTTTAPPVPPPWETATCTTGLRVWGVGNDLLVSVPTLGLFKSANTTGTWTPLGGDGEGSAEHFALARTTDPSRFWVGGAEGVFATIDGGSTFVEVGALTDVRSLSAHVVDGGQTTVYAIAGNPASLSRSVDGGPWTPVAAPLGSNATVLAIDASTAFIGSGSGVQRTDDGGSTWQVVPGAAVPVVGSPVRRGQHITWLRADGGGVVRTLDGGANWTTATSTGDIAPDASSLVELPGGELVTVTTDGLVVSTDGGTNWDPYGPRLPFAPAGVTFSETAAATFAWSSACGAGAVVRVTAP